VKVAMACSIEQIEGKADFPLGVGSKAAYRTHTITLLRGDAVFVVSDRVDETMNAQGEFYTLERLNAVLRGAGNASAAELVRAVTDHVGEFAGSEPKAGDMTALAIR
jgi:phosphoserine phosphatase RsbU/P